MEAASNIRYSELKEKTSNEEAWSTVENPLTNFKSTVINLANNAGKSNYQRQKSNKNDNKDLKIDIVKDLELASHPAENNHNPHSVGEPEKKMGPETDISFSQPKKQKRFEKKITCLIAALALLNFILLFIFLKMFMKNHEIKKDLEKYEKFDQNCMTDECLVVAGKIFTSIDKSVDPCDNFYEYACGGWLKKTLIPSGFPRWGI